MSNIPTISMFYWELAVNGQPLLELEIYKPLRNLPFFWGAKVDGDTVIWNDEVDIAPEHLYECSLPIGS